MQSSVPRLVKWHLLRFGGLQGTVHVVVNVSYSDHLKHSDSVFTVGLPLQASFANGSARLALSVPLIGHAFLQIGASFTAELLQVRLTVDGDAAGISFNSPRIGSPMKSSVVVTSAAANGEIGFLSIDMVMVDEPAGQQPTLLKLRVGRQGINGAATVRWNVSQLTVGLTPSDAGPASGQLTFATGQQTADIELQILSDALAEVDEDFVVSLIDVQPSTNQRLQAGASQVTVRIRENDSPGGLFEFDAARMQRSYVLQEEGAAIEVHVVRRGGALVKRFVKYDAYPGGDAEFYGGSNVIRFDPGVRQLSGTLMARGDTIPEVGLSLSAPVMQVG